MGNLERLLSSRVKAEVFRLLFGPDALELHVREIARRAKLNEATVRQELSALAGLHLVALRRDGNRAYYRAETGNPLFADIRNIVLKTSGLIDILRAALVEKPGIRLAFVFGPLAPGGEKPATGVDLMIIGSVSLRQLSKWLSGVAAQVGRDVNPHVLTPREFSRRRQAGDRFVTSVLGAPRLFVIGTDMSLQERVELRGARSHESSRQEIAEVSPTEDHDLRGAREPAPSPDWAVWDQA
jgi:DNA-binding transcriptional ArsR family regulator